MKRYGKEEVQTEDDLYLQVARTVNRKPITKEAFDKIIEQINEDLALSAEDVLVDFCCGNGLFTYELKDKVKQIIGIDFSQPIIDTANKFRWRQILPIAWAVWWTICEHSGRTSPAWCRIST